MLAVSRNLSRLKDKLSETGELSNTYLILTSDNGYHLGQHRLGAGKMTAYEEDIRIPLAVSGPGVASGGVKHMVLNTDLAPTIANLAGVAPGLTPDGRSFAPLLPEGRSDIAPSSDDGSWRRTGKAQSPHGTAPNPSLRPPTSLFGT
jgi:N-acetylglucosamine-6-sulfatase